MARRNVTPLAQRIARRSVRVDLGHATPCSVWTGATIHGYGKMKRDGRMVPVHVAAWESVHGAVPEGMQVDHLCHDSATCAGGWSCPHRACHEISHLQVVTGGENIRRGKDGRCVHGHLLAGSNLHVRPCGRRMCRACNRERMARLRLTSATP